MELPTEDKGYLLRQDEQSLYNLVTDKLKSKLPEVFEVLTSHDEDELPKLTKINDVEHDLKISFWREYDYAIAHGITIKANRVFHGVCSQVYWDRIINDKYKLAYILTPPKTYEIAIESMLSRGLMRLSEIIKLPIVDDKGKINVKVAELIKSTVDMLDKRRYGMYTQKTINVNQQVETPKKIENIEAELKRLEAIERELPPMVSYEEAVVVDEP